jgi:hypothetical protein
MSADVQWKSPSKGSPARAALYSGNIPDPDESATFQESGSLRRFVVSEQKLYLSVDGFLRILRNRISGKYRIVMTGENSVDVLVNYYVLPGMELLDRDGIISCPTINYAAGGNGQEEILFYAFSPVGGIEDRFRTEYGNALAANQTILNHS